MVAAVAQRDALILEHTRVAKSLALDVAKKHRMPADDLCQEAFVALVLAADSYDPNRGAQFVTYAVWVIRGTLFRAVKKELRHSQPLTFSEFQKDKLGRPRDMYVRRAPLDLDGTVVRDGEAAALVEFVPTEDMNPEDAFWCKELDTSWKLALASAARERKSLLAQALAMNRACGSPRSSREVAKRWKMKNRTVHDVDEEVLALARSMM